ncbi:MAG: hypothetical protein J6T12_09135, partial [Salinivirgaceae bacterium]|nr:hypothetical protein [Salinivirgaceae bacterium]
MKQLKLLPVMVCLMAQPAFAQQDANTEAPKWTYKMSGFVDPQFYMDTREVVSAREEQMLFYPAPKVLDAEGNDINAQPSNNALAITARIGLKINAPDALNAKIFGYLEGDFTGATNDGINMLRLRHAYLNMRWQKSNLLLGQYWHPMVAHEVMPGTRPLNMGIPFHPYSRYVQARYTQYFGGLELSGIAAFQLDNKAVGPDGGSTAYLRNSCIPELNAQLCYRTENMLLGAMVNYVLLQPRTSVNVIRWGNDEPSTYKTDTKIGSTAVSVFGKLNVSGLSIRFQGIYGDNLTEQGLMGGYIESGLQDDNTFKYSNFGTTTFWVDLGRTKGVCRPGLFAGFGRNNNFGDDINADDKVFGRGIDIDNVWRIQPRVGFYPTDYLNFFGEVEYTNAAYGKRVDNGEKYHYESDYNVGNYRFIVAA